MLKVNEYFEGQVKSIAFSEGASQSTLGVMAPGEYQFDIPTRSEVMHVIRGEMHARCGDAEWQSYGPGSHFDVPAPTILYIRTEQDTAYLCQYKDA